jgi:hypothetical protein
VTRPRIEIHIDGLVLEGFSSGDRLAIAASLERELERVFAERPVPQQLERSFEARKLQAGSFAATRSPRPASLAAQVADRIYRGFGDE